MRIEGLCLVKIGVDSSGKWGDPPIWIIAVRRSKTKGQICCTGYLSKEKYETIKGICKNWKDKFRAALIYKVVSSFVYDRDIIIIHVDFHGKTRKHITDYLKKLFREMYPKYFPNKPLKKDPEILFSSTRYSPEVREADVKSKKLRHGMIPQTVHTQINDPSFKKEIEIL